MSAWPWRRGNGHPLVRRERETTQSRARQATGGRRRTSEAPDAEPCLEGLRRCCSGTCGGVNGNLRCF
jgi:hypothetical protein